MASAKLPNSTVANRIAVTAPPKPGDASPANVITADSTVPAITIAITGLLSRWRGDSFRKASRSALRIAAASTSAGLRAGGC